MKRIIRQQRLTADEAAKYQAIREQVAEEMPELLARHYERIAALDKLEDVLKQLRAAREQKGMSVVDVSDRTGMDPSVLSKLETDERPNPTLDTLVRYADAVGLRLEMSLIDAS